MGNLEKGLNRMQNMTMEEEFRLARFASQVNSLSYSEKNFKELQKLVIDSHKQYMQYKAAFAELSKPWEG